MSDLYKRIEALCKIYKISITTMCKESGASRASLSDLKMGRNQKLSAVTLDRIADYFDTTVDYLLGRTTDPENSDRFGLEIEALDTSMEEFHLNEKAPTDSGERKDVLDEVDIAFYGDYKELSEDDKETLRAMARVMKERQARKNQEK